MSFFTKRQTDTDTQPHQPAPRPVTNPQVPPPTIGFETVLGANSELTGDFVANSNVRIDGTFKGTLKIAGNVLIGETAKIEADVNARNISIAGAVRGNVNGKKVQLLRTGRVWGDITATALSTEEGAFIDGKISMVSPEQHPEPAATAEGTDDTPAATPPTEGASGDDILPEHPDSLENREA